MTCRIPDGFLIGVGSSAYQVEGAPFQDGKGESCLDRYHRNNPKWNADGSNGDIACDSYNKTEEDIKNLKDLRVDFYRFSISWTRLIPNGDSKQGVNQAGLEHYRRFISRLLEEGIIPMVTIFHWDMPQLLQELGGWTNSIVIDYYVDYCRLLFKEYGNMVKHWFTVNEPQLVGEFQYGGGPAGQNTPYPPGVVAPGIGDYLAQHNQLIAHARAYRLYQTEFKATQKGKLGLALNVFGSEPKTNSDADKNAAKRSLLFEIDALLHPLVKGDYPPQLREIIDTNSKLEGRTHSRLPTFTQEEINIIKDSFDFIGLNHYSSHIVSEGVQGPQPSQSRDAKVIKTVNPENVFGVSWLAHEPEGFRKCLNYIRNEYGQIPIYISENGCDDPSGIHDVHHIQYIKDYLKAVVGAINDGCNVLAYTVWSFMDSYEWASGYKAKFGLYHVDFDDKERKRTPKDSVNFLREIIKTRIIPE